MGNFDYVVNDKNTSRGGGSIAFTPTNASTMGCAASATTIDPMPTRKSRNVTFPNHYVVGRLTSVLSNNFVNEARLSLQRWGTDAVKTKFRSPIHKWESLR